HFPRSQRAESSTGHPLNRLTAAFSGFAPPTPPVQQPHLPPPLHRAALQPTQIVWRYQEPHAPHPAPAAANRHCLLPAARLPNNDKDRCPSPPPSAAPVSPGSLAK